MFVPDNNNNRVLVFALTSGNLISSKTPAYVLGQSDFITCVNNQGAYTSQSGMYGPGQLAVDPVNQLLYVPDTNNNRVLVFSTASMSNGMNASYVLGQTNFTNGGQATTQSGMAYPSGCSLDSVNQLLYVADTGNRRVLVFNVAPGTIASGENASYVIGQPNFTSNTEATSQSVLAWPTSVAVDTTNSWLYVVDSANIRVMVFSTSSLSNGENASYVIGQTSFTTGYASLSQSGFWYPQGFAFDDTNNRLFVADQDSNRVMVFSTIGNFPSGENASDILGQFTSPSVDTTPDYTKNCYNNGASPLGFNDLSGVAIDATNHWMFVPDGDNNRVLVFALTSGNVLSSKTPSYVLGQPDFISCGSATTQSGMWSPNYVAVDPVNQLLYVPDFWNNRVLVFSTASMSNGMNASYVLGQPDFVSNGAATTQSGMYYPQGVALDVTNQILYEADNGNNRVLGFSVAPGTIANGENASFELGQADFVSTVAATTQSGLTAPDALAFDATSNRLFVGDSGNSRALVFTYAAFGPNASDILGQFASPSSDVTPDYVKSCPNNGASPLGFNAPAGSAIDSVNHRLFVMDAYNSRVLVFTLTSGNLISSKTAAYVLGQNDFVSCNANDTGSGQSSLYTANDATAAGLAFDPVNNRLFVMDANNNRVLVFNTSSLSNGMNASYVLGATDFNGDCTGCTAQATLYVSADSGGAGIALDSVNQLLYVADNYDNRVLVFNVAPGTIANGENASYELGQPSGGGTEFTTTAAATTQSGLNFPDGLALDTVNQLLYVSDTWNSRIMVFNVASGTIANGEDASYVLGATDFTGDCTGCTGQQGLDHPMALAYDSANDRLFVNDQGEGRVMIFNTSSITNGENTSYVLGDMDFNGTAEDTPQAWMSPYGLSYDSTNSLLYVSDAGDSRVMIFNVSLATPPTPSSPTQSGADACAIAGGQLYCWGGNTDGEDGLGNTSLYQSVPQLVGSLTTWTAVSQGDPDFDYAACGIAGGALYCWGNNAYGELGLGNTTQYTTPQQVGSATNWTVISQGGSDACGIAGGALYCWGANTYGEDGNGPSSTTVFVTSTTYNGDFGSTAAAAITAANNDCQTRATASGSLAPSGTYLAWFASIANGSSGANDPYTTFVQSTVPYVDVEGNTIASNWTSLVSGTLSHGIEYSELGGSALTGDVWTNVGTNGEAEHNGSSAADNCAEWENGTSSDHGYYGVIGSATGTWTYASGNTATCSTSEHLYCFQQPASPSEQNSPVQVGSATNWTAISQGVADTCGIAGGKLYCWGLNQHGVLGLGNTTQYETPQQVGSATNWTAISIRNDLSNGDSAACGISGGALYCWGGNGEGEVGNGNTTEQNLPVQIGSLTTWTAVSAVNNSTCAIAGSQLYCWGSNLGRQLGLGNSTEYTTPQAVYGLDSLGNGESAEDELGQYSSVSSPTPDNWNKWGANNGPNPLGFGNPQGFGEGDYDVMGFALDATNHRLFASDYNNSRVLVYNLTSSNAIPTGSGSHTASYVLGQPNFYSGSGATAQSGMEGPAGLAYDSVNQRLFVADTENNRVLVFNTSTVSTGMNASYVLGQPDFVSNGGGWESQNGLYGPEDVAFDGLAVDSVNHRLFVAEPGNSDVLVYNTSSLSTGMSASYYLGYQSWGTSAGNMTNPVAVAYDSNDNLLFVADSDNSRVLVFNVAPGSVTNGMIASYVLGQVNFTNNNCNTTQSTMCEPTGLAYDAVNSRLFLGDQANNRVLVFDNITASTITSGMNASYVLGQTNFTSYGQATTQSGMSLPSGLSYDSVHSQLYVVDGNNDRVLAFNVNPGTIANGENAVGVLGQGAFNTAAGGCCTQSGLWYMEGSYPAVGVLYDSTTQDVYVPDYANNRVMIFNVANTGFYNGMFADYVLGQADFYSGDANGAPGTIADDENASDELGQYTSITSAATDLWTSNGPNNGPTALGLNGFFANQVRGGDTALDTVNHYLYVSDSANSRVLVYALNTDNSISTVSGGHTASYVLGQTTLQGADNCNTSQSGLCVPLGLAYDAVNQRLFVADQFNNRVLVFNMSSITSGMNAAYVLGEPDFTTDTGCWPCQESWNFSPLGLAYDATNQRLFVADVNYARVLVFNVAPGTIANGENASYVLGQPDFTTYTYPIPGPTQSDFSQPTGLAYDATDQWLFVADNGNGRVLVFSVAPGTIANGENASYVLGQPNFTSNAGTSTQSGMYAPSGLDYDPNYHRLFVTDTKDARALVFNVGPLRHRQRRECLL